MTTTSRKKSNKQSMLLVLSALVAMHGVSAEPKPTISAASVHPGSYAALNAIDGNPGTRWASAKGNTSQLELDFGKTVEVNELKISWEAAYAIEYKLEIAGEDKKWITLFHQKAGKGGVEQLKDLKGKGRHLRILCLRAGGHDLFSIWELTFPNPEITKLLAKAAGAKSKPVPAAPAVIAEPVKEQLGRHGVKEIVFAVRADGNDGHWYANLAYYSYDENKMLYGKGGRLCKLNVETGENKILIDDPEGTVRDPTVHYDAKRILFSWRKGDSRVFHLYECDIDGGNIRQLTDGLYDDIEPCYLPDGGIIFVSGRGKRYVNCWLTQVAIVYRCDGDGGNIRQLSANVEHDNTPWVLSDGRIVYQRWEYVDRSQVHYHHLWTMNPDGTDQMVYFGNLHAGGLFIDAKPIPGTDKIVFINSPGHGQREHSGSVAILTDELGPDEKSSLRNVSRGGCRDPWPLSENLFIVAKGRTIVTMDGNGKTTNLYTLTPEFAGRVNIQEPRPVIVRKREPVVPSRVDVAKTTGRLILNNAYVGRNMEGIKKGDIKKLLVLESLPKPINFTGGMDPLTYGGSFTLERIVGTIPVEEDGSAFMELPANRAFFFVALDEKNNSVKRMQSFLTVMPGEVLSCVGCHEERGKTPVDTVNMGLLKAVKRAPSKPEPIKGIPDVFDFPRDIQPILDKHCLKCHDNKTRKGGVLLTGDRGPMFSHSYVTLTVKKQVADGRNQPKSNYPPRALGTSASPLMKKIDGSHHKVKVSQHEEDMIRYWIESAACYPGTYASLGHGGIGGYQQNRQINTDVGWPTAAAFKDSVQRRCSECHKSMPKSMSDEIGMSFWQINQSDKRHVNSRHIVFNLTNPDQSLLLLAPLPKSDGGLELCKPKGEKDDDKNKTRHPKLFENKKDKDYQAMIAHIVAGKEFLENELTRFDMPNFKPRPEYFREMKRYGILSADFNQETDPFNVYDLDRKYWESLWYQP
ncbi:MAG: discoidin domain-containing protein [Kiritimatiellia bacterium]|nr:discoidin domain-containing protein [Kiritimatiellia bacterium]